MRRRPGTQKGGRTGGGAANKAKAEVWHKAAWPIWWKEFGQYSEGDPRRALRKTVAQDIENRLKADYDLPVLKHIKTQCTRWSRGDLSGAPVEAS